MCGKRGRQSSWDPRPQRESPKEKEERPKHAGDPGGDTRPSNWGLELAWFSGSQGWTWNGDVNFLSVAIQLLTQAVAGQRALQTLSNSASDLESPRMGPGQEGALASSRPGMSGGNKV